MTNICRGNLHQTWQMLWFDAMCGQAAADADAGFELPEPGHEGFAATGDLADMGQLVKFGRHRVQIPGHHGVDHQRIGQAMVQVTDGAQRVGTRVHRAQEIGRAHV